MLANRYTTTELVNSIRRTGHMPASQTLYSAADLLAIGDFELETALLRQILSVRENYYLTFEEFEMRDDCTYPIPTRAIGGGLLKVQLFSGTSIMEIYRSEISEQFSTVASPSGDFSFIIVGNNIVLRPNPQTGTLRLWFLMKPNAMVETSAAAQISAIDTGTNIVTVSSLPTTFTTATDMDFIQNQPHFDWLDINIAPTNISGFDLTFSELPPTLAVGDWIALAGQTPVPQIPVEFRALLTQRVVVKYYEGQGYLEKMKAAEMKLQQMEKDLFSLINPRISEEPKRIVANSSIIGGFNRWRSWTSRDS